MWRFRAAHCSIAAWLLCLAGCSPSLPTYPALGEKESLAIIAQRLEGIHAVTASCSVELTAADGSSIRLDGAMVFASPDRLRVRGWKFGNAVMDLTAVGDDVWLFAPQKADHDSPMDPTAGAHGIGDAMMLLGPGYFQRADARLGHDSSMLIALGKGPGDAIVTCEIDRATLTPRVFRVEGAGMVVLDDYRMVGSIPWAHRVQVRGREGEIHVLMHEVEINGILPEGAFKPPARAVKQP